MKALLIRLFFGLFVVGQLQIATAQITTSANNPSRSFPPISISLSGLYQTRTYNDTDIYQISSGLSSRLQLTPSLGASVSVYQATVEHDSLQRIHGFADLQAALTYVVRFTGSHVAIGVAVNVPNGKNHLSRWAYDAAFPAGFSQYDFAVPFYGQGSSIAPSLTWVYAPSSRSVIGLGVSYRIKGSYEPHRQLPGKYEWGNELSLSAAGQWQMSPGFTLSGDVTFTRYGGDKINEITAYSAGNRIVMKLSVHKSFGPNDLWISALYRNVGTNRILFNNTLIDESITATPGSAKASLQYRVRINHLFRASFTASGQLYWDAYELRNINPIELIRYEEVFAIDQLSVFKIGLKPEFSIMPALTVPLQVEYLFGDLTGLNAGVGLTAIL